MATLLTNNPQIRVSGLQLDFYPDFSVREILLHARNLLHQGWRLANHPLAGNLQPHQQPYKSLVLISPDTPQLISDVNAHNSLPVDELSIALLATALERYDNAKPNVANSETLRHDCAFIDKELVRATIMACGGLLL